MRIVVKKSVLKQYIREMLDQDQYPAPQNSQLPAVVNEPPMAEDPVVIDPAVETQVSEPNMPIHDDEWAPGNNNELQKAASQIVQQVPEGHRQWFWGRIKNLVMKTVQNVEDQPGTGDMDHEVTQDLPADKQTQRPTDTWRDRQGLS